MYQPPARPDPWADRIAGIAALRGMLGESTIKESSSIDITTRVTMPLLQAISIGIAWIVFSIGCWALVDGLVIAFGIDLDPAMYLMTLVIMGALVLAIGAGVYSSFKNSRPVVKWSFALAGSLFVITAILSAMFRLRAEFNFWRLAEILAGSGAILGAGLLLYHQLLNIADPYWRTSPAERELLAMWRKQPDPIADPARAQRIPYRHNGRRDTKILIPEPETVLPELDEYEMLDFLDLARDIGLGRRAWVEGIERKFASTGRVVSKTAYNKIIQRLVDMGYVIGGGDGYANRWAAEWDAETVYNRECVQFEDTWGDILDIEFEQDAHENKVPQRQSNG